MAIETNLNTSPYFDDFDEDKNFHRVLFRPGYAVQARELTQIQSILQNQVERFANEIMIDGTVATVLVFLLVLLITLNLEIRMLTIEYCF